MSTFMVSFAMFGPMNISAMRTFDTEKECWEYAEVNNPKGGTIKVYELFKDKEPRLCKPPIKN